MSHFYFIIFWQYVVVVFFKFHYLLLKLFFLIHFHANRMVCMFTLIFCVGTWLFQPVNYCLMLLWLQIIPRNKKKCCSQTFWMLDCGWLSLTHPCYGVRAGEDCEEMEIDIVYAEDYSPNHNFSSVCYHFTDFLLYQKVVSFLFKWSPEHSSSTLSFTYRWLCKFILCSSMQQEKKGRGEKTFIRVSRVFTTAEGWLWVSLESGLCESVHPNEILHNHMVGLWATQWQQHLLSQLVFTLSIFRANGPSQRWSLTCNSPLM